VALDRAVGLATLAGGGLFLLQALALPVGTAARPGAGFFPVVIAVFACLVGAVATVQTFLSSAPPARRSPGEPVEPAHRARVISAVALLTAFCLALPWIGYPIAAFLFVAILLRRLGSRWPAALATAILSAALSHYLFAVLLDVPLPSGPW
jgi:putative tricarboxylic transport membrane protein